MTSGLAPEADVVTAPRHVSKVPEADMQVLALGRLLRKMHTPSPTFQGAPDSCQGLLEPLARANVPQVALNPSERTFPLRDKIKPNTKSKLM
jgi:hypothetical protein